MDLGSCVRCCSRRLIPLRVLYVKVGNKHKQTWYRTWYVLMALRHTLVLLAGAKRVSLTCLSQVLPLPVWITSRACALMKRVCRLQAAWL